MNHPWLGIKTYEVTSCKLVYYLKVIFVISSFYLYPRGLFFPTAWTVPEFHRSLESSTEEPQWLQIFNYLSSNIYKRSSSVIQKIQVHACSWFPTQGGELKSSQKLEEKELGFQWQEGVKWRNKKLLKREMASGEASAVHSSLLSLSAPTTLPRLSPLKIHPTWTVSHQDVNNID